MWCSRFDDGGLQRARDGRILCGRGECARQSDGAVHCSVVEGGAALRDSRGRIRCEGRCEPGSADHCERTIADIAD